MSKEKKKHIWIYAYKDGESKIIHQCYIHDMYLENDRIELPPLQEPWHWCVEIEACKCDE